MLCENNSASKIHIRNLGAKPWLVYSYRKNVPEILKKKECGKNCFKKKEKRIH